MKPTHLIQIFQFYWSSSVCVCMCTRVCVRTRVCVSCLLSSVQFYHLHVWVCTPITTVKITPQKPLRCWNPIIFKRERPLVWFHEST